HLYLESAKAADRLGFKAIWTPERHFTSIGAIYPSPAVLSAAAAMVTKSIQLRSGSVVLPVHDPVRVAEEWAVVDHLSGGRVSLSFASGWVPNDFIFSPQDYANRHEVLLEKVLQVQKLWRGESLSLQNGLGERVDVAIQPRPLQKELPTWITTSGSPRTFEDAGKLGANLLTHMVNMNLETLTDRIRLYRQARKGAGYDPATGMVAVMLHTYVTGEAGDAIAESRPHLLEYFRSHAEMRRNVAGAAGLNVDVDRAAVEELIELAADEYINSRSLIGTAGSCAGFVRILREIGVNEVACFIDFGVEADKVLSSLEALDQLRRSSSAALNPESVGAYLKERFAGSVLPERFVVLDKMPLTQAGQIDRNALRKISASKASGC